MIIIKVLMRLHHRTRHLLAASYTATARATIVVSSCPPPVSLTQLVCWGGRRSIAAALRRTASGAAAAHGGAADAAAAAASGRQGSGEQLALAAASPAVPCRHHGAAASKAASQRRPPECHGGESGVAVLGLGRLSEHVLLTEWAYWGGVRGMETARRGHRADEAGWWHDGRAAITRASERRECERSAAGRRQVIYLHLVPDR